MNLVASSLQSLRQMFLDKTDEFINLTDNVHMLWLEEIQQEAMRMFSRDFNAEPELMPKTPSQKKNSRRKRVSVGRQEEGQVRRRLSKGRRSNLRVSAVSALNLITEEEPVPETSTSAARPKRATRANKQTKAEVTEQDQTPQLSEGKKASEDEAQHDADMEVESAPSSAQAPPKVPSPGVVVCISSSERLSAENAVQPEASSERAADIAPAAAAEPSHRSSVRCSLKLRHSLAGLRHSMSQESVRRASRRSILKRRVSRMANSMCSNNDDGCSSPVEEDCGEGISKAAEPADAVDAAAVATVEEEPIAMAQLRTEAIQEAIGRVTRSVAANSPKLAPPSLFAVDKTPNRKIVVAEKQQSARKSRRSTKRKAPEMVEGSPTKRFSPPKKSQSAVRPNMRSFLHTVQKNQMLMMTPSTLGRTGVIKSFIKHTTPLKLDPKMGDGTVTKERNKLEALKKKLEQEEERMKKMEEEKKKKQEELRRKREERLRRVNEAKVKEEQKEEQKKKKIEQKMAQIDEKNDKRLADEKAKKAAKRQEELEQKKKLEEEARKKKEEEKRQQELLAKMKAEEEEEQQQQQRLAEARRVQLERERLAAAAATAERERLEREKALALKMEVERAAREKERKEQEQKRRAQEERRRLEEQQRLAAEERAAQEREAARQREAAAKQGSVLSTPVGKGAGLNVTIDIETATALKQTVDMEGSVLSTPVGKGPGLNVTVDIEKSPQSYKITPKGGNKPLVVHSTDNYGMDQNSDDSTDDESAPRKPIPSWAQGAKLQQVIMRQYFHPPDLDAFFGPIETPRLEKIFFKSKPRFFKRTSSAVWHEPMQ